MKLLIISATPKHEGICHSFVTAACETAAGLGADVEVLSLGEHKLLPCKMCGDGWGICRSEHRCSFGDEDGFNLLQKKFQEASAFVFITPVYWGEVSEALKVFLDKLRRCQATKQWNKEAGESFFANKPSILVASAGGSGNGILSCLTEMERAISHMGGDKSPKETNGICDYIGVNRWNQEYKREALKASVSALVKRLG